MVEHIAPTLHTLDIVGPAIADVLFMFLMSLLAEPARQQFNAILVAGAGAAYLNGGLGAWEFAYIPLATFVAYKGLRVYPCIGLAWFMHTGWDIVHHFFGTPIWPWMSTSSAGCAVFDAVIGSWFLIGAPTIWTLFRAPRQH